MERAWLMIGFTLALGAAGCGGSSESTETAARGDATAGEERPAERDDGSQITGLLGTIRRDQVDNTLQPRMDSFMRCLAPRLGEVEFLGGEVRLSFRIHTDGTVMWVFPSQTTIGDRQAEQCVLDVARRARFPRPQGGEAEFTWGFAFDPPEDVRPPLSWEATRVGESLMRGAPGLAQRCGVSGVRVTAYIAPGGQVMTAGASAPDADSLAQVDCVIEAVRGLTMPDPGSYAAKVTFLVQ